MRKRGMPSKISSTPGRFTPLGSPTTRSTILRRSLPWVVSCPPSISLNSTPTGTRVGFFANNVTHDLIPPHFYVFHMFSALSPSRRPCGLLPSPWRDAQQLRAPGHARPHDLLPHPHARSSTRQRRRARRCCSCWPQPRRGAPALGNPARLCYQCAHRKVRGKN